jgi:hypothetical protein
MFTNIYKKLLDARAVEIQNMLSTAILDQKLRHTEKHERYLLLVSPGNIDGQRVLHLSFAVCSYSNGYPARGFVDAFPEAYAVPECLTTDQWWCSKSKAGVHGFAFAKMLLNNECYLRYIPIEHWGMHDTRAYRIYFDANGIGFDMVRSEQSFWVDHNTVNAVGALRVSSRMQNNITILKTQAEINRRPKSVKVTHHRPKVPAPLNLPPIRRHG